MFFVLFFWIFQKISVKVEHMCLYIYQYSFTMRSCIFKVWPHHQYKMFLPTLEGQRNSKSWKKLLRWRREGKGRWQWRETEETALGRKQRTFSEEPPRLNMETSRMKLPAGLIPWCEVWFRRPALDGSQALTQVQEVAQEWWWQGGWGCAEHRIALFGSICKFYATYHKN